MATNSRFPNGRRVRSEYNQNQGVPNGLPMPQSWVVRLLSVVSPTRAAAVGARYAAQSNSAQIIGVPGDGYATKLQSNWRSAATRNPRADSPYPISQRPTVMDAWPGQPGSRWFPMSQSTRKDRRPANITPRPQYAEDARFTPGALLHSSTGNPAMDLPLTDTMWPSTPPARIVHRHQLGLALMAGTQQRGTRQNWGMGPQQIVIAPPPLSLASASRGVISVRGSLAKRGGTGRNRIPAVFTPRQAQ